MQDQAQILEEARNAGIDLDLLDSNLALSVKERWRLHDEALAFAMKLQCARIKRDGESDPTPRATR